MVLEKYYSFVCVYIVKINNLFLSAGVLYDAGIEIKKL
tara:strand:+ start:820 stop:933 length:114 start_codon:yes stop_codon:yes gene_type:complete